jgi:hypothetical protein
MFALKNKFGELDKNQRWVFSLAILLFVIGLILKLGLITSSDPYIRGVEPNVLFSIQEIMAGDPLYPDPEAPPFPITQYTPLYYVLVALLSNLFNIVPGEQFLGVYYVGRTISVGASLGISIAVFLSCRRYGAGFLFSLVGAIITFVIPIPWFSLLRPDGLAAFLGILTVIMYARYLLEKNPIPQNRFLILAGALGFLSFFSKQNGGIFLVAVFLYPALRFRLKEIAYLASGVLLALIITSLIFLPFYSLIPGADNYFYDHIIGGLDNGIDLPGAYSNLYSLWLSWYFPLAVLPLGGIILLLNTIKKQGYKNTDEAAMFLALSFFTVTVANLIAGIKYGSSVNYMIESMVIGVLLLTRLLTSRDTYQVLESNFDLRTMFYSFALFFILVLLGHQTLLHRNSLLRSRVIDQRPPLSRIEIGNFFEDELLDHPDALIYSEVYLIKNLLFDHIIFPQEDLAQVMYSREVLTYSEVSDLVEDGTLRYLVTRENFDPPSELYGSKLDGFELYGSTSTFDIYINTQAP